jgi:hypothetical protein
MRNHPKETQKEYEDGIKKSFDKCALKAYVRLVYSLPAYKTFLKDHIDDCFGLFATKSTVNNVYITLCTHPSSWVL